MELMVRDVAPVFALYFQSHFAQRFGDELESVMREYGAQIEVHGLRREDVTRGLLKIRSGKAGRWLPNPLEFAELCMRDAQDLGLPSMDEVASELERYYAWRARHPSRRYPFQNSLSAHVIRDIGHKYKLASNDGRERLLAASYHKWLNVARKDGLPEETSAIAEFSEPRPIVEEYLAKKGKAPSIPAAMRAQMERVTSNIKRRKCVS